MEVEEIVPADSRGEKKHEALAWGGFAGELKKAGRLAAPIVAATVSQYLLQVVSVVMVGHLGQVSLSAVAIATALTNVTGFSLLSGLAGGLETLCGQAFGAQHYGKLGTYTYSATISLALICFPICLLWIFMDKLLILTGQDPLISLKARNYSIWLIPGLFGSAIVKPLVRYLQTQSLILPMLTSSLTILGLHIALCWCLVFKLELGNIGAAIAISVSSWVNVVLLGLYVKYSSACEKTRMSFSKDAFLVMGEFFRFAIPAAVMVCLKWWSLELLTLVSGLLPNPKLESSVLVICLTITTLHFTVPYGLGAAASTRVSNELGAGNPKAAQMAGWAVMFLAIIESIAVSTTLFCCRYIFGYAFSSDKQVVDYLAVMAPLICLSIVMDSIQGVLSGVARGGGWQHIGAYINLGAFYVAGLPVAIVLGFVMHLKAKGLWIGIVAGSVIQSSLLSIIASFTNWKEQANKARERIFDGSSSSAENLPGLNEPKKISDEVAIN